MGLFDGLLGGIVGGAWCQSSAASSRSTVACRASSANSRGTAWARSAQSTAIKLATVVPENWILDRNLTQMRGAPFVGQRWRVRYEMRACLFWKAESRCSRRRWARTKPCAVRRDQHEKGLLRTGWVEAAGASGWHCDLSCH